MEKNSEGVTTDAVKYHGYCNDLDERGKPKTTWW